MNSQNCNNYWRPIQPKTIISKTNNTTIINNVLFDLSTIKKLPENREQSCQEREHSQQCTAWNQSLWYGWQLCQSRCLIQSRDEDRNNQLETEIEKNSRWHSGSWIGILWTYIGSINTKNWLGFPKCQHRRNPSSLCMMKNQLENFRWWNIPGFSNF